MSKPGDIETKLMQLETRRPRSMRGRFRYDRIGMPSISRPPKREIEELLESYYRRWLAAREARVEKCIADLLGHAREHTAIVEVPPRHAMSTTLVGAFAGIDRSVHPESLQWARPTEPFSFETFRTAFLRILAMPVLPPVKPWITRQRAEQLEADGVRRSLIETVFEVY
jgi:hypothetical protein